jgi:signal transduction histidine kinase
MGDTPHTSLANRVADRLHQFRIPVLIVVCALGLSATLALTRHTHQTRQHVAALTFHRDVENNLMLIEQAVDLSMEQVRSLATFIRSARRVDQNEFQSFVLPTLRRHPTIHMFGWVPRISHPQRSDFERAASVSLGRPFEISRPRPLPDADPAASIHALAFDRSPEQPAYFPLTFAAPLARTASAIGYDLGSDPRRLAAMDQAASEGRLVTTPMLTLHDEDRSRGFLAFMPVYRGEEEPADAESRRRALVGFAVAAFVLEGLIDNPLSAWHQPNLQVCVFDRSQPEGEQLLYARQGGVGTEATIEQFAADAPMHATRQLLIGGRPWLLVSAPTPAYLADLRTPEPWIVLVVGLTLTGLSTLVLWGMVRSGDQAAAMAAEREAANAQLLERILEREEAEEALAHANRELRQINTDMERFVGAVSHDLKSPLVAAEMLISVMQQAVNKGDLPKTAETSRQIQRACRRMRRIIDDLLEHQRAGFADLRSQPVDLTEAALHVIEDHRDEAVRLGVHVHLDDDMPTIRADRGRIRALLDNLVGNALKYGVAEKDPTLHLGAQTTADEVRLHVSDNGPGVPEEHRERVWELFQRISRDEEGTGIGLAIVRRVAEAHGGRAWMECPPTGGTTFWIAFPADRIVQPSSRLEPVAA